MTFLLDTSVWLRASLDADSVPDEVGYLLNNPKEVFGLSIFSLWEVAKKHQQGKLPLPLDLSAWLKIAVAHNVRTLPLTEDIIIDSVRLPNFPVNDPADQLIVATARIHQLTLLTTDTKLKGYRHARIHYFTPLAKKK